MRCPLIHDYSRLNMQYAVMSKRKLAWFVEQKKVSGWDDPRFPTVKGMYKSLNINICMTKDISINISILKRCNCVGC